MTPSPATTDASARVQVEGLRNVAIIAHVDHGKTTLVDAMLRQSGAFREGAETVDRVMDNTDLEREKGITILAKNTAVRWTGDGRDEVKINIVDTPGHADFGGEVERALTMVDGVVLLVDASEGPLPQTRFVLRKTLELGLPVILAVNKIDRSDARIDEVVSEVEDLFMDLDADIDQIDFPIVYLNARDGRASMQKPSGTDDLEADLTPLFELLVDHLPAPVHDPEHPLQAWVTNLDASQFVGRLALCRMINGRIRKGQQVAWCRSDGRVERAKVAVLYVTETHERIEVDEAGPGEIIAVAGLEDVTIGETLSDPEDPRPMPVITVDEPSLAMTIGVNTSPLAGRSGDKVTARQIKARLDAELIGNVSLRVLSTERPDAWEVHARGELQLAVLVETMRREGFELTVGKPQVVTREIDGTLHEPVEAVSVDVPEEYLGAVSQLLATRKGQLVDMVNHGTGWRHASSTWEAPARGLHRLPHGACCSPPPGAPALHAHPGLRRLGCRGPASCRAPPGRLGHDRRPVGSDHRLRPRQPSSSGASCSWGRGTTVYEGMVIGENSRAEDMDVNICKEKKLTNMRAAGSDNTEKLAPPRRMSLEHALEFLAEDECVEVTPDAVRLRKVQLDAGDRARTTKALKHARA